ncbi:hypothetical protein L596_029787 [Steinernema carpocapsae]|uniref:Uncharacterized protein n=1 Tax=Steinernema carpocapsae TaxID=34508 RepID=A0A4U5LQU3_STECR|nr:hypothetical protein L596_029787 [Steinernema carpocapsae]
MSESVASSAAAPSSETSSASKVASKPTTSHHRARFGVTLLVLFTIGLAHIVAHRLGTSDSFAKRFLGANLTIFAGFFSLVWMQVHSFALSRKRRAYFDEVNILETYQPRKRTMGHLFDPEPPTPGPVVKISEPSDGEMHTDAEKAAFNQNRDAHYANMYEQAMRLNREMEASNAQASDPSSKSPSQAIVTLGDGSSEAKTAKSPPKEVTAEGSMQASVQDEAPMEEGPKPAEEKTPSVKKPPSEKKASSVKTAMAPSVKAPLEGPDGPLTPVLTPIKNAGEQEEEIKTDLSSDPGNVGHVIDDNTLRGVSEIKSINLMADIPLKPKKKRSRASLEEKSQKSLKGSSGRKIKLVKKKSKKSVKEIKN